MKNQKDELMKSIDHIASTNGPEDCRHLNLLDPVPSPNPDFGVRWCCDCGALLIPGGEVYAPKTFKHIFACPMCAQDPVAEPVNNIFIEGKFYYECKACGFKPDSGSKVKEVTLEHWNRSVWKIITGDVVELRKRYQEALKKIQLGVMEK